MNNFPFIYFLFALIFCPANCFTVFFNQLFRTGSLNGDLFEGNFDFNTPKCFKGSYFFNGSCYFISGHTSNSSNSMASTFDKFSKNIFNEFIDKDFADTYIGKNLIMPLLPSEATWEESLSYCKKLDNSSELIYFDNEREFEYIIKILFNLKFKNNATDFIKEESFFIGLNYNMSSKIWLWLNNVNLTQSLITVIRNTTNDYRVYLPILSKKSPTDYEYRRCGYINLRGNREVNIDNDKCDKHNRHYLCKYVIDRCFNNTSCGLNGDCVNVPYRKTFECRCRILYDGKFCEKWSTQGVQMIASLVLVVSAITVTVIFKFSNLIYLKYIKKNKKNINRESSIIQNELIITHKTGIHGIGVLKRHFKKHYKIIIILSLSVMLAISLLFLVTFVRLKLLEPNFEHEKNFNNETSSVNISLYNNNSFIVNKMVNIFFESDEPLKICKHFNSNFAEDYWLVYISLPLTLFLYFYNAFWCQSDHRYWCNFGGLKVKRNRRPSASSKAESEDQSFYSPQIGLRHKNEEDAYNSCDEDKDSKIIDRLCGFLSKKFIKNKKKQKRIVIGCCTCQIEILSPVNPFSKKNRFISAVIYAAYTYNILKIFEHLIIGDQYIDDISEKGQNFVKNLNKTNFLESIKSIGSLNMKIDHGILNELLSQVLNVLIIGLRYYPLLLCTELKRKRALCYFLCSLYLWFLFIFYLYLNTFCLISASQVVENAEETNLNISSYLSMRNSFLPIISSTKPNIIPRKSKNVKPLDYLLNITLNHTNSNITQDFKTLFKHEIFSSIMYEKLMFYLVLSILTLNFTVDTVQLLFSKSKNIYEAIKNSKNSDYRKSRLTNDYNPEIEFNTKASINEKLLNFERFLFGRANMSSDWLYTKRLLEQQQKPKSFLKNLIEKHIYRYKMHFKYSKQFLNTYVIAFILLYYITCILVRTSSFAVEKANDFILIFINLIVELFTFDNDIYSKGVKMAIKTNKFSEIFFSNIKSYIIIASCLTTGVYVLQLFLGIRTYQKHVLDAYKGVYVDIPSPKRFSSVKKTVHSLHFSGFMIGYLLWGYLILFEVTIAFIIIFKFMLKFYFILEKIAKIFLPILVMFFLKRFFIWYISRFFLVHKSNRFFLIKSPKLYFITFHFNFFFDCFLGSFVCLMRMAKSSLAALFFMPRLDYSVFGRMLESADIGYLSYVNFIHLEVNQTNPIKIAFSEILLKGVSLRNFKKNENGINEVELSQIERSQNIKKKWFIAITLARNPALIKYRKGFLKSNKKVPKVESLEKFLERNVKNWIKTKSTPSLCSSNTGNQKK